MHKKDLDIRKIIDNYLTDKFSRQDFIDLMDSISREEGVSEFQNKLAEEWEKSINQKDEIDRQEILNLHFEASRIIANSEKDKSPGKKVDNPSDFQRRWGKASGRAQHDQI